MIHLDLSECDSKTGLYYYVLMERFALLAQMLIKNTLRKIFPS